MTTAGARPPSQAPAARPIAMSSRTEGMYGDRASLAAALVSSSASRASTREQGTPVKKS